MSNMPNPKKRFSFTPTHKTIQEILTDHKLAALGDAYTNLVYSLYISTKTGQPAGGKADGHMLSQALKQAGLRNLLGSRVDRHKQADAAEALLVYVWLQSLTTIRESVGILIEHEDVVEAFSFLLSKANKRLNL